MQTDHLKGALFSMICVKKKNFPQNKIYKTLQAYGIQKRALFRWPVWVKASVSIEACIAIPIFLFAFLEMLSLLQALSVYSTNLYEIQSAIEPFSQYAYADELPVHISEAYLQIELKSLCSIDREHSAISVRRSFSVAPIIPFAEIEIPMSQYYFVRMWTGYEKAATELQSDVVYITETGQVYHIYRDCTHLSLSIQAVSRNALKDVRNEIGEVYKNCPRCLEEIVTEEIDRFYITQTGDKYHGKLDCSALKRTVFVMSLEDVKDRALCLRCAERKVQ